MNLLPLNSSPPKLYGQARRIIKETSRASNPDWYKSARELDLQWHIWVSSVGNESAVFNRVTGEWWTAPKLPKVTLIPAKEGEKARLDDQSRNLIHEALRNIISSSAYGIKAKSLGVCFHLVDEIRIRDLAPDFSSDPDFETLNELLKAAPQIAMGDDALDDESGDWRLCPLVGAKSGSRLSIATRVSSRFKLIVNELGIYGEVRNIPVIVNTFSGAVEAVAALPLVIEDPDYLSNTVYLLQYEHMTLVCTTGERGELQMIRPLLHRNTNHLAPTEIMDVVTQSAALNNIKDPRLAFLSLNGMPEADVEKVLQIYRQNHPDTEIKITDISQNPIVDKIPGKRLELAMATINLSEVTPKNHPLEELHTRWAFSDYYSPTKEVTNRMPTRGDLRMLKFAALARTFLIVCLLGFIGWSGMDIVSKMRSESWKLDSATAQEMDLKVAMLGKEKKELDHWENLLTKRSEGWLAMQALLDLFPDDGGVIVRSARYQAEATSETDNMVGLSRSWSISGFANPEVAKNLATIGSRTRVAELLNRIAEENQADYLKVDGDTRSLEVNLQQRQGTMPSSAAFPAKVARHFRTTFDLRIAQGLSAKDELALSTKPLTSE
ncbi:MAG: hypothetical protein P1U86_13355 [Verrucomicrobiales bacterium]|nr:hypothetical protein [Verrucomicrobiales bacterium]